MSTSPRSTGGQLDGDMRMGALDPPAELRLTLQLMDGSSTTIVMASSATLQALMLEVQEATGILAHEQQLVLGNDALAGNALDASLASVGLDDGTTLLVCRVGPPHEGVWEGQYSSENMNYLYRVRFDSRSWRWIGRRRDPHPGGDMDVEFEIEYHVLRDEVPEYEGLTGVEVVQGTYCDGVIEGSGICLRAKQEKEEPLTFKEATRRLSRQELVASVHHLSDHDEDGRLNANEFYNLMQRLDLDEQVDIDYQYLDFCDARDLDPELGLAVDDLVEFFLLPQWWMDAGGLERQGFRDVDLFGLAKDLEDSVDDHSSWVRAGSSAANPDEGTSVVNVYKFLGLSESYRLEFTKLDDSIRAILNQNAQAGESFQHIASEDPAAVLKAVDDRGVEFALLKQPSI